MVFFMLMKIVCAVLVISTFANSENTSTNTGNVTDNEDPAITSAACNPLKNDCKNGGTCTRQDDFYYCTCLEGTSGDFCEVVQKCEDTDFCGDKLLAKCYFDIATKSAACECYDKEKMFDPIKEVCKSVCGEGKYTCSNGGTCSTYGQYSFCSCPDGTSGDLCQIVDECSLKTHFCGQSSTAVCSFDEISGKATCTCLFKTQIFDPVRRFCGWPCDPLNNFCENGGTCEGRENYTFCSCPNGTYGDFCEKVRGCEDPFFCGRSLTAHCYFDKSKEAAACKCTDGKFYYTEKKICIRECDERDTCRNGGSCRMSGNARICFCPEGTSGDFCEVIADCRNRTLCGYDKNAECYYDELSKTAACRCNDKKTYFDEYRRVCRKHCNGWKKGQQCENGGECEVTKNKSFCYCMLGTSGDLCENVHECKNPNNLCGTSKDVECYFNPVKREAACRCRVDGAVYDPKRKKCSSDCDRNPCHNGGTCSTSNKEVKCACKFPYSGDYCESDTRRNIIGIILICSVFATGILVSIVTSCCALKSIQKVQRILGKANGV